MRQHTYALLICALIGALSCSSEPGPIAQGPDTTHSDTGTDDPDTDIGQNNATGSAPQIALVDSSGRELDVVIQSIRPDRGRDGYPTGVGEFRCVTVMAIGADATTGSYDLETGDMVPCLNDTASWAQYADASCDTYAWTRNAARIGGVAYQPGRVVDVTYFVDGNGDCVENMNASPYTHELVPLEDSVRFALPGTPPYSIEPRY